MRGQEIVAFPLSSWRLGINFPHEGSGAMATLAQDGSWAESIFPMRGQEVLNPDDAVDTKISIFPMRGQESYAFRISCAAKNINFPHEGSGAEAAICRRRDLAINFPHEGSGAPATA